MKSPVANAHSMHPDSASVSSVTMQCVIVAARVQKGNAIPLKSPLLLFNVRTTVLRRPLTSESRSCNVAVEVGFCGTNVCQWTVDRPIYVDTLTLQLDGIENVCAEQHEKSMRIVITSHESRNIMAGCGC